MNDIKLDEIILNHLYNIIDNKICLININSNYDIPIYNSKNNIQLKNKTILVIAGGGIKGLAMLGAIKCLYENNLLNNIVKYAKECSYEELDLVLEHPKCNPFMVDTNNYNILMLICDNANQNSTDLEKSFSNNNSKAKFASSNLPAAFNLGPITQPKS